MADEGSREKFPDSRASQQPRGAEGGGPVEGLRFSKDSFAIIIGSILIVSNIKMWGGFVIYG